MVAIIFEGKTDEEFLNQTCNAYSLPIGRIKYFNFGGKDDVFNIGHQHYDELENDITNLGKIDKVLIIVDADNKNDQNPNRGFNNTETKLKETIKNLYFGVEIDYYIMCDEDKNGNLESFLLSILDDEQKKCIKEFRKCYKYELGDKWVYNTFYKQKKYPFDFNHTNFNPLKKKLEILFT